MYLNTHSYYSLRYGTMPVDELVEFAKNNGATALALTDINNASGIFDFVKACKEQNVKPIAGMELRNGNDLLFVAIAKNPLGFREINQFVTDCNLNGQPLPQQAPEFEHTFVIYPFGSSVNKLRENEFIGVRLKDLNKIRFHTKAELQKMVLLQPITFPTKEKYLLHQNLRAIDNNILRSQLQPQHLAGNDEGFYSVDKLHKALESFPDIINNTERLLNECYFEFDFKAIKNKKTFTGYAYDDKLLLEKLAIEGLAYRYGNNPAAEKRVRHELEIIQKLEFASYFLITWDIIRYSMSRGFYHVGRGSGANSVVAYCLKITDVDPIELDLYFERFLNPKRLSAPDFDIDYSWHQRDDVIDYVFKRYGKDHTALLGTMSSFKGNSILRELGKVYGLPKKEIDQLSEESNHLLTKNEITKEIMRFGELMQHDFPNMRSIHAGGILISEEPITSYSALDLPPKGFATVQWDMYIADNIKFEKLDILSQRGIGHIKEAVEIIRQNRKVKIDEHDIDKFKNDPQVKRQLHSGDTIGCFYIESPAMRGLLKKLQCDNYLSLVAASSIIRPGVASSGMMREFIYRFHNPDKFTYLHPVMKEQLEETYGVMIYQEDVLKVCHHFAGLDLGDADVLRRMMSAKNRDKDAFAKVKDKFFSNCRERGYADELTTEVWRQIESFAGYSFSKAHSASYAVESFQSLYLKSYFPKDFMVAVINNFGGFYSTWVYVNEAKKCGANVELPCINQSDYKTNILGEDVYLGFQHLQSFETKIADLILAERNRNGKFLSLDNFISRVPITLEQLTILIRIDAFRFTGIDKKQLLWEAHLLLGKIYAPSLSTELIATERKTFTLPKLEHSAIEDLYVEIEIIGFPVTRSHFDLLQTKFRGEIKATELIDHVGKTVRMVGNLVTIKYVTTKRNDEMNFGTWLDEDGNFFDTTHFSASLNAYPFKGNGVYLILGRVVEEFGFPSLEVEKMAKLSFVADPRY